MLASTEHAVSEYFAAIRAMDVDRLMTAFSPNAELYDPVGTPPKFDKEHVASVPLGRIGQPKDIADIAVFLASDQAGWLTGELITAGGGLH